MKKITILFSLLISFTIAYDNGPQQTFFNINKFSMKIQNNGFFDWNGTRLGSSGHFPKHAGNIVFTEGIIWGGKVSDKIGFDNDGNLLTDGSGDGLPIIRVNGSMYNSGLRAGKVLLDSDGKIKTSDFVENSWDQQIWRVRSDWRAADLSDDVSIYKNMSPDLLTEDDINEVRDQYQHDWEEWPANEGAPFVDSNGDGIYTAPTWDGSRWVGDLPGVENAPQTIWLVANDLENTSIWGSPPIGIEMQMTIWGYNSVEILDQVIYKRIRLIYTGLPGGSTEAQVDSFYLTQFVDPDIGDHTDDYAGLDTLLNMGYSYNAYPTDSVFKDTYNLAVPAVGYDFLDSQMSSFTYFASGSSVDDPDNNDYSGTLQWYNLMQGYLPRPEYPTQSPFVDPITNQPEKFVLAGDPVTGTGWVDGISLPPGDRRLVLNTGPYQLLLGDTIEVVISAVAGLGTDNISSLVKLKDADKIAQSFHDGGFDINNLNVPPTSFEWKTTLSDTIIVNSNNGNTTHSLSWTPSLKIGAASSLDYLVFGGVGVMPKKLLYVTKDTILNKTYEDLATELFSDIPFLPRVTMKFTVSATDGIDTTKITGEDRILFIDRYEYLSTVSEGIPTVFALHENYPNPFNPSTTLRFDLPEVSDMTLTIYNMLGQKVRTFDYQNTSAGYHSVTWHGTNDYGDPVGAGVYLYQLRANQYVKTRKMVLLK
jgi:hypothetical protein